jgi:spore maturation protein CgeB
LSDDIGNFFPEKYSHEISFVGSLYENASFAEFKKFPDMIQGYLDGIIAAQKKLWGCDIISELMTDKMTEEIYPLLPYTPKPGEFLMPKDVYICEIQKRITSEERIEVINRLSCITPVSLFTGSDASLCPDAVPMGIVSYTDAIPTVFHGSEINLNITLRSITSGIPLRALDIMGCGGFLLTNYQPELCEYFTPDVDFVYFEDMDDMTEKAHYYLSHDKEREQIAFHGHKTATEKFSYREKVGEMLSAIL